MNNAATLRIAIAVVALLFAVALAVPQYWEWVDAAAHRIPTPDATTDYAMALAWAAFLFLPFMLWPVAPAERRALVWLWLAKIVVMLGYMLFYEWSYGLDAYTYYHLGTLIEPSEVDFGQARGNALMTWLASVQTHYITPDSYHGTKVTFGYLGLVSTWLFYRAAKIFEPQTPASILWILALFPSTLQWTSILGKDPIVALGVSIYAMGAAWLYRGQLKAWPAIAGGVTLAWIIRPWMAVILVLPLLALVHQQRSRTVKRVLVGGVVLVALVAAALMFSEQFRLASIDDVVVRSTQLSRGFSEGGSARSSEMLEGEVSFPTLIAFAPVGLVTALIRPLPGEVLNAFGALAGVENLVLIGLMVRAARRRDRPSLRQPALRWATLLVVCWGLVYGYVCFHNAGTSVRYRQQIFPVFVALLLALAYGRRTQKSEPQASTAMVSVK